MSNVVPFLLILIKLVYLTSFYQILSVINLLYYIFYSAFLIFIHLYLIDTYYQYNYNYNCIFIFIFIAILIFYLIFLPFLFFLISISYFRNFYNWKYSLLINGLMVGMKSSYLMLFIGLYYTLCILNLINIL